MMIKLNGEQIEKIKTLISFGSYEGIISESGLIYFGGLYRNLPHGKGAIILPNGNAYEYEFCNGKLADGRAIIFYPDGSFYEGEVSNSNRPYGQGIIRNLDGSTYYEGNWERNYDPKIVWFCSPPFLYDNGEFYRQPMCHSFSVLHPGILLDSTLWTRNGYNPELKFADVMFPHLQDSGCPQSKNRFRVCDWEFTPEEAVQAIGYRDLKHYLKWQYAPEGIVLERIHKGLEILEWGKKIFGLLAPFLYENGQSKKHNIDEGLDFGLDWLKSSIERQIEEINKDFNKHYEL